MKIEYDFVEPRNGHEPLCHMLDCCPQIDGAEIDCDDCPGRRLYSIVADMIKDDLEAREEELVRKYGRSG